VLIKKEKMKTVLTKFLAISSVALLMLASCKKDGALVVSNGGKPGALTANVAVLPLDKTKVSDTTKVIMFNFAKTTYGFNAAGTNTLQIDVPSDNWVHPTSFTLPTGVLTQGFSTPDFNSLILKLNIPGGTTATVNVRLANSLATNVKPVYSNVLSLTVTPFNLTSWLYVVGAFDGWPSLPAKGTDSLISATGNGIFTGIINFPAGDNQFLILPQSNNYNNKYATNDPTTQTSATVTIGANNNFYAPTAAGQYIVTLNTNNNTISFAPADFYTIIGSAPPGTAWSNDYTMKYVNDGNGAWVANNVPMAVGEYKFRMDDAWNTSWGPSATAGTAVTSGAVGDGNIQLTTAGNYNISFVMPQTAFGGTALATTTFTAVKQ
jgi:starch-binding outer membrane protein SusE/F